ncbi:MAG: class I SAM-dependent methyltransferase, partial [Verrucomicrobia bacterium]|nr:class I SAM-dependent methyltransferase [Verrucomicrobiota bacterium]
MTPPTPTAYDEVLYPDSVFSQTHPGRMGATARILGLNAAPVERCRVLELGCGGGNNLIALAHAFPGSRFFGVDLASRPLAQGRMLIDELGLENIRLEHLDVCAFPEDAGRFDYIIAHGLYSWVPDAVKERILSLCRAHLEPEGIAFISYNAYPGCHLRDIARGIMHYHVRRLPDPREKIKQGRALIKFLGESIPQNNLWQGILQDQSKRISRYSDNGLFHDDLSPCQASYFYEFAEAAERQGLQFLAEAELQFLAEAEFHTMKPLGFADPVMDLLARLEQSNILQKEQYLDFLHGRGFRQTLLCHQSASLSREIDPKRAFDLHIAADTTRTGSDNTTGDFESTWGTVIGTSHPVAKAALTHLGGIWPRSIHFSELLEQALEAAKGSSPGDTGSLEENQRDLGEFVIRCYELGFVELHLHPCPFVIEVSPRPTASPLARVQLRHGDTVSNLRHRPIRLLDHIGQHLVQLLDGTRDRESLRAELEQAVRNGQFAV